MQRLPTCFLGEENDRGMLVTEACWSQSFSSDYVRHYMTDLQASVILFRLWSSLHDNHNLKRMTEASKCGPLALVRLGDSPRNQHAKPTCAGVLPVAWRGGGQPVLGCYQQCGRGGVSQCWGATSSVEL